jgi:hypothetical protein
VSISYDNDSLVEQIKIKGSIPDGRFSDQELLDLAYIQLLSVIYPLIISMREEFFLWDYDQAVTASQSAYPIFERALGDGLREAKLVIGAEIRDLARIDPQDITSTATGDPECFYLKANDMVLYPTPGTTSGTLRQTAYLSPGRLVPLAEVAEILTIDRTTDTVTIGTLPTGWTTANSFDFHKGSGGYQDLGLGYTGSLVTTTMTFTSDLPTTLAVGDYLALEGEAGFPQVSKAAQALLVQSTVTTALKAMGHNEASAISDALEKSLAGALAVVMAPRIQGAPRRFRTTMF